MIEFTSPFLFLLLLIPVVVRLPMLQRLIPAYRVQGNALRVPFFARILDASGEKARASAVLHKRPLLAQVWTIAAWSLLVVALAGPEWLGEPVVQTKSARDLMVAVDLSGSMQTTDFSFSDAIKKTTSTVVEPPSISDDDAEQKISRLSAVKTVLHEFVQQREHDRLGLIVFGDAAYLQAPFTSDHRAWLALLDQTDIGMAGQSTVFGDAIGLAIKLFDNSESENKVLIILTDGNDTGSLVPPVEAAKVAAEKDMRIYTIAVGDPLTIGEEALDLEVLQRVAELTKAGFYQAYDRQQLRAAYSAITDLEPELYETLTFRPRFSLFHYPLAVLVSVELVIFLGLFVITVRKDSAERKELAGYAMEVTVSGEDAEPITSNGNNVRKGSTRV